MKPNLRKRLFFDIETSFNVGIFWRSGYNQTINPGDIIHERAIICICYKWEGEDEVKSLTWDKDQSDKSMLKEFLKIINKADEIVAHNGDNFDMKWIRTRCIYHGLPMIPHHKTVDTLKQARRYFNFNSNKLDYIAKFLGVGAKLETGGMSLWKDIVFKKDKKAMTKMVEYCKMDVVVLESVFNKLKNYTTPTINYSLENGGEEYGCPECGGSNGIHNKRVISSSGSISHWIKCKDCSKHYKINETKYILFLKNKMK